MTVQELAAGQIEDVLISFGSDILMPDYLLEKYQPDLTLDESAITTDSSKLDAAVSISNDGRFTEEEKAQYSEAAAAAGKSRLL